MRKLTGAAIVTVGEGQRISYTYSEIDETGNVRSQNNRASFIALEETVLAAINTVMTAAAEHMEGSV